MADYRLDCCGGFPSHTDACRAKQAVLEKANADKTKVLDGLYAKYGELIALATRSTSEHNKLLYGCQADGVLVAIRIVEGKDAVL